MGLLDNVGGLLKQAGDGIGHAAENASKAASDAWNTAVEDAKAGANAVATVVRDVDAKKQQIGAWIDSKEQQLEHKVDEGRAWLRENGGVAGKLASDQIGLVEGVGTSLYDAGKGIVKLADGVNSLTGSTATSITGIRWIAPLSEFEIRQLLSAFSSTCRARSGSVPLGTCRRARTSNPTKRVVRSMRSKVPVTSHSSDVQAKPDARATARKVRIKQSPTAATRSVSGDHRSPGPSNGIGDADRSVGNPPAFSSTSPVAEPFAATV